MPNKPEPLFIDGHYHYTLSSYDPVEATLTIPHLTDEEVGYGIAGIVAERGWKEDGLPTDAWVAENVEGLGTLDELKQAVREELEQINARYVESTKGGLCAEELAKRVEQRVPAAIVDRARDIVRQGFEMQAAQNGVALTQLLAASGMSEHDYEHAVDEEARAMAEQNAALDAIVDEYAIYVDETELPAILGLSPKDAKTVIDDAREHGASRRSWRLPAAAAHLRPSCETPRSPRSTRRPSRPPTAWPRCAPRCRPRCRAMKTTARTRATSRTSSSSRRKLT